MSDDSTDRTTSVKENAEVTSEAVQLSSAEHPPPKRLVRLWVLFAAHVILGLFFSIWSAVEGLLPIVLADLLMVPVFGIILAQSSLLGFWTAFSKAKLWMRLIGLILGTAYLEALLYIGMGGESTGWLVALSTGGITVVFGLARWRYANLRRFSQKAPAANQEGLRFSIRGLMLFTVVVAVGSVIVKILRKGEHMAFFGIPIWSLCFALVGLASVWAGLGLVRPLLRSVALLLMSAVLGTVFAYGVVHDDWKLYFYLISTFVLQASVLIASLLVVRSCGYRLVRKSRPVLTETAPKRTAPSQTATTK